MTTKPVIFTADLTNQLTKIERDIALLKADMKTIHKLFGGSVNTSQLNLVDSRLKGLINTNAASIARVEEKLSMISLPDETRNYLLDSEIADFRANFQKLVAMMSDVQDLYDSLVAYVANATT